MDTCEGHPDIESGQDLAKNQKWVERVSVEDYARLGPVKPDRLYPSHADPSRSERLWDEQDFCGWQKKRRNCAGSYVRALKRYRFDCTMDGRCHYGSDVRMAASQGRAIEPPQ